MRSDDPQPVTVDVHLGPDDLRAALERDALDGLSASPKTLPPVYFYDDEGSRLFDEITRLSEYYLTNAEREILEERSDEIVALAGADTLVELGSGTSEKTRLLLDALQRRGALRRFVPFDVSEGILLEAADAIAAEHPGVRIHAVVGDFHRHLGELPREGTRMVAFLGSTIGNLDPGERRRFLADLAATMGPEDTLLLGTDLVKDAGRLVAAYDDAAGVTAAFNRNVLHVLNRELGADFEPDRFAHVARWDPVEQRIEMLLRSDRAQDVHLKALELDIHFAQGEDLRTEISSKFTPERVTAELGAAGLEPVATWTDGAGDFQLTLARRGAGRR